MTSARHGAPRCLAWLIAGWWLAFSAAGFSADLPASPAPHYIYDGAGWLGAGAFATVDARLQAYERESSSQLVVAIFPAIPQDAEMLDFSQKVFEKWKPGQAGKDNGAILFIFAADKKLRIQTGYGLEGVLPDARCKQIIDEVITPRLKSGQREEAVKTGVEAIIAATKGEYQGTGKTQMDHKAMNIDPDTIIFLIVIAIVILNAYRRGKDVILNGRGAWHGDSWSSGGGGFSSGGGGGGFSGGGGSSGGGGASGGW